MIGRHSYATKMTKPFVVRTIAMGTQHPVSMVNQQFYFGWESRECMPNKYIEWCNVCAAYAQELNLEQMKQVNLRCHIRDNDSVPELCSNNFWFVPEFGSAAALTQLNAMNVRSLCAEIK